MARSEPLLRNPEFPPTPEPEVEQPPVGNPEHGPNAGTLLAATFDAAANNKGGGTVYDENPGVAYEDDSLGTYPGG